MMQDNGESTPLLRRGVRSKAFPLSQRDTSGYSDDGKQDRRGSRLLWVAHQKLQTLCLILQPPLNSDDAYEDMHNDESWKCTFGTLEQDGIWINLTDKVGALMALIVWILIVYSAVTVVILSQNLHLPAQVACVYCTICALALCSHAKTAFTDPGTIPSEAVPTQTKGVRYHTMCSLCQTYKPNRAHHCRICNRCVSRMDHHCPWMNNCIGAANMKHFILFLLYTWTGCVMALLLFGVNYFFCSNANCEFSGLEVHLVRAMAWICFATLIFTSSMLMNVVFGIVTGNGTIDRIKKKANDTWEDATEEATPLTDIFGIGPRVTWCLPTDPIFDDYDRIMGYATRQRLLRLKSTKEEPELRKRVEDGFTVFDV